MSNFKELKVLTVFEGSAVGGRTVEAYLPDIIFFFFKGSGIEIVLVERHWWEGEVGKGGWGHCFKWELSLDLKQSRVLAVTIS